MSTTLIWQEYPGYAWAGLILNLFHVARWFWQLRAPGVLGIWPVRPGYPSCSLGMCTAGKLFHRTTIHITDVSGCSVKQFLSSGNCFTEQPFTSVMWIVVLWNSSPDITQHDHINYETQESQWCHLYDTKYWWSNYLMPMSNKENKWKYLFLLSFSIVIP